MSQSPQAFSKSVDDFPQQQSQSESVLRQRTFSYASSAEAKRPSFARSSTLAPSSLAAPPAAAPVPETLQQKWKKFAGKLTKDLATGFVILLLLIVYLGGSLFWLLVAIGLWYYATKYRAESQAKYRRWKAQEILDDPAVLKAVMDDIPAWISFPDIERVTWLNKLVLQLWPNLKKATEASIKASLVPIFNASRPAFLTHLDFGKLDLGEEPVIFTGIKVHSAQENAVLIDIHFRFNGKSKIVLEAGFKTVNAAVRVNDLSVSGVMRVTLEQLYPMFPCFSVITISFMDKPQIDFDLAAMKLNVMYLPGFNAWLQTFLKSTLASLMVWPKKLVIPLGSTANLSAEVLKSLASSAPSGILRVTLIGAKKLSNTELIGKSDPYVILKMDEEQFKSKHIDNSLDPSWNEDFEFMVTDLQTQVLKIKVYDYDQIKIKGHTRMGYATVALNALEPEIPSEQWIPLTNCKAGTIGLLLTYKPFENPNLRKSISQASAAPNEQRPPSPMASRNASDSEVKQQPKTATGIVSAATSMLSMLSDATPATQTAEEGREDSIYGDADDQEQALEDTLSREQSSSISLSESATLRRDSTFTSGGSAGALLVTIEKAENLVAADMGGTSDPYAELVLGSVKFKTNRVNKSLNPVWNENVQFKVFDPTMEILRVKVFDWNRFSSSTPIGNVDIPIRDVAASGRLRSSFTLNGVKSGSITLDLKFKGVS